MNSDRLGTGRRAAGAAGAAAALLLGVCAAASAQHFEHAQGGFVAEPHRPLRLSDRSAVGRARRRPGDGVDHLSLEPHPPDRRRGSTWTLEAWDRHWRLDALAAVATGSASGPVLWTVGQQRRIARSVDGGVSWTEQHAHLDPSDAEHGKKLVAIAVYDDADGNVADDVGVAVGERTALGGWGVLYTKSGGAGCGWQHPSFDPASTPRDLDAVCASGRNAAGLTEFWAVGASDAILVSRDHGASWTEVGSPTSGVTWTGVTFTSLDEGFVVGAAGECLHVTQASTAPTLTLLPAVTEPLHAVHGRNANVYAVGDRGKVYAFDAMLPIPAFVLDTDGSSYTTKPLAAVQVVRKVGGCEVFAAGLDGTVLRFDGGSWGLVAKSQTSSDLCSLAFLSPALGFAVGRQGAEAEIGGQSTIVRWSSP